MERGNYPRLGPSTKIWLIIDRVSSPRCAQEISSRSGLALEPVVTLSLCYHGDTFNPLVFLLNSRKSLQQFGYAEVRLRGIYEETCCCYMFDLGNLDDLLSAPRQEAARAYLRRITIVRSLEFESAAELCDESWMEYINRDCMTDASDPSCPTPFLPYEKTEEPFLQMTKLQIEADHVVQHRRLESPTLYLRKRHIRDAL